MLEGFEDYLGREQSKVKHEILRQYLQGFAHVVGFHWSSITYIDGFSGPWNAQTSDLSDTSFSIALNELRQARETHATRRKKLAIRCVFVEKDIKAYHKLQQFAESIEDAEIFTINDEFENALPEIISFVQQDANTFPFTLIDPTGSSGFKMSVIAPLLRLEPGEVLVNFMLEFIRRYIEQRGLRQGLADLFGTDDFDENLAERSGLDRDDAITGKYCECLSRFCNYKHVLRAHVLHPDKDRLRFQLIYGTRHPKGVEKFKEAEKRAMELQEKSRAHIEVQKRAQPLFDPDDMPDSMFYTSLRERYLTQAEQAVATRIGSSSEVSYDALWLCALSFPLVWESDLKKWLKDWKREGLVEWAGLQTTERILKYGKQHSVVKTSLWS